VPAESAKTIPQRGFSRTRDDDQQLASLAERQHGVVGRRQLLAAGWSAGSIEKRVRSGRLHRLHAGAYLVGHRLVNREGRWMAAVLVSDPGAVLSHWSAAALWMIRPNSRARIDVTVPHRSRSSERIRRHISQVPDEERTIEEEIPVTTVPRTILDLAATESTDTIENLLRESEFLQLSDRLSLPDLLQRYPGKRGTRKLHLALDRLIEEPEGRRRSRLEERFSPFLRKHNLPLPRYNHWIVLGDKRFQVDCHWPEVRQIVELDGWQGHSTRTAFREDRARDRRLRVAGYGVTHVTWNQLDDEPEAIAADLRILLAEREIEK
jgi:predicted transcriptional regulator of viral defense system